MKRREEKRGRFKDRRSSFCVNRYKDCCSSDFLRNRGRDVAVGEFKEEGRRKGEKRRIRRRRLPERRKRRRESRLQSVNQTFGDKLR